MGIAKNILLSSHGTVGARAAELMAFELCTTGTAIHHLIIVPDLWKHMMGDDWLNNGITRDRYARYLESELGREIDDNCARISQLAKQKGIPYTSKILLGKPDKCLVEACNDADYDLVIIGSPRPKGTPGLRSRMATEPLVKSLTQPLLIVPYPND